MAEITRKMVKMAKSKFAFNAMAALMIFVVMASFAGTAFAVDVAPVVSLSANSTSVTTSVTLTAVAVDVLDNAGIQWIKIYENGGLLDTKSCGGISSCTFVKVVIKASPGVFSYYSTTQDNGGHAATSNTVVVTFNTPPVLAPIGNQVGDEGQLLQFTISATDPGDTLTYSASGLPLGANFVGSTFTWTPSYTQSGVYPGVTFIVTDSYGSTDSEAITITVNNVNRNPFITSMPVETATENVAYSYDVDATDPDLDTLAYSLSIFPTGMTIDSISGLISWTPDYTQAGDHDVSACVTDGPGAVTCQGWTISVANVNRAPTWDQVPTDQTIDEDASLSYDVNATDLDIEDTVLYSVNDTDFSIDANGVLTWTPAANWNGVRSIQLTASDGSLAATADITVTVNGINDAPIITSTPVTIADEDALYEYFVVADDYDFPYGDGVVFELVTAPSGMVINWCGGGGPVTCRIQWTPNNSQVGINNNVEVRVNDSTGATVSQPFTVTVANTNDAPVFSGPIAPQNFDEDGDRVDAFNLNTYFSDVDVGDTLTYSVSGNSSVFVTINPDGTVDFSALADWNGNETLTFTATDTALAQASSNPVVVTVTPQPDPPVWTEVPTDQTIDEDSSLNYDVNASDPDIGDVISYYVNDTDFSIDANGLLTWTPAANWNDGRDIRLTASDGSLDVTADITITVTAVNDAPVITSAPVTATTEDVLYTYDVDATDVDVGDTLTFAFVTFPTGMTIDNSTGVISWTPNNSQVGGNNVNVSVTDGTATVYQAFTIAVANVNDAPVFSGTIPNQNFNEDTSLIGAFDLDNYFTDDDTIWGDTLTYSVSGNSSIIVTINSNGVVDFSAPTNWNGNETLTFTATDNASQTAASNAITVTVNPVPDYYVSIISNSYYQQVGLLQNAVYTITVNNTGDTADNYNLTVQNLNGANQTLNQSALTLNPGQTGQVTLSVSDSNPGVYDVTVTATGNANAVTSTIVTNVTTADTGWVYDSTVNGTPYTSQSTGIWGNINNSLIKNDSVIKLEGFDDVLIIDSTIDNTTVEYSWLTGVNATASSINNSILTNCVVINATVKNIVASNCYLKDGVYDPPGGGNNLTGSNITNSYTYQSNVTYSNVTYSNITYSNVNNSVIDNSNISYSTVYDSTVRDSTLSWATVINGALITGSQLVNSTADNSTVTNSVLTRSNVTDSTIVDSILTDTSVTSSTLTNVTATNSVISGTTIANVVLTGANLTDGVLYNGTITLPDNRTYNATDGIPFNLSNPSWPSVSLGFSPSSVDTNTAVTFTAAISGQFDTSTTMTYEWDFDNNGIVDQTSFNSTTALKTYSAAASYAAKVTVRDGHGNSASNTVALTVAYAPAPSGGGSGSSWHEPQDTATYYLRDLFPGMKYTIAINLEDIAWTSIEFSVNESVSRGEIKVRRLLDGTPSGLENVYQYIEASSTFAGNMMGVSVSYKINNSWLAANKLDNTKTRLARYHDGTWKYLSTAIGSERNDYTEFTSVAPGFSTFAITVPKVIPPQPQLPPEQPEQPEKPVGELTVAAMPGGSPTFVPINVSGLAVTGITVTPSVRITDVKILAKTVAESDVLATLLAGTRQYFELSATSGGETLGDSGIENVKIIFKLSKADLKDNGLDASSVRLERWSNGCKQESRTPAAQQELCSSSWQSLPTTKVSEDNEYVTYEAVSTGFSLYAIAASAYLHPALVAIIAAAIVVVIAAVILSKFNLLKKRKFWRDGGEPLTSETVPITSEQDNSSLY